MWSYRETGGVKGGHIQPCSWHCCSAQPFRAREHQLPSHKHTCTGRASFAASSFDWMPPALRPEDCCSHVHLFGISTSPVLQQTSSYQKTLWKVGSSQPFCKFSSSISNTIYCGQHHTSSLLPRKSKLSFLDQAKQQSPLLSRLMEFEQLTKSCYFSGRGGFGHTETALNVFGSLWNCLAIFVAFQLCNDHMLLLHWHPPATLFSIKSLLSLASARCIFYK